MKEEKTIEELEHLLAVEKEHSARLLETCDMLEEVLNNPYGYEAMKQQMKIKTYKDILSRDSKPIANLILNMGGLDFCQAVGLNDNCGCSHKSCTDCIHDYLLEKFSPEKPKWIYISDRYPTRKECHENDNRFIVTDGQHRYQRLFDAENSQFIEPFYMGSVAKHIDNCVLAWQPFPDATDVMKTVMERERDEICGVTNIECSHCNPGPCESRRYK